MGQKKKWLNLFLWIGLGLLISFVIVTSIIVNYKQKELKDVKDKNKIVSGEEIIRVIGE